MKNAIMLCLQYRDHKIGSPYRCIYISTNSGSYSYYHNKCIVSINLISTGNRLCIHEEVSSGPLSANPKLF